MSQPKFSPEAKTLFSPCDLCGSRDYPPNVKVVAFEVASHPLDYVTRTLHVCNRCEAKNRVRHLLWANECSQCDLMNCSQENKQGEIFLCDDCEERRFRGEDTP